MLPAASPCKHRATPPRSVESLSPQPSVFHGLAPRGLSSAKRCLLVQGYPPTSQYASAPSSAPPAVQPQLATDLHTYGKAVDPHFADPGHAQWTAGSSFTGANSLLSGMASATDEDHSVNQIGVFLALSLSLLCIPWAKEHPVSLLMPVMVLTVPIARRAIQPIFAEAAQLVISAARLLSPSKAPAPSSPVITPASVNFSRPPYVPHAHSVSHPVDRFVPPLPQRYRTAPSSPTGHSVPQHASRHKGPAQNSALDLDFDIGSSVAVDHHECGCTVHNWSNPTECHHTNLQHRPADVILSNEPVYRKAECTTNNVVQVLPGPCASNQPQWIHVPASNTTPGLLPAQNQALQKPDVVSLLRKLPFLNSWGGFL